ncbi:C209E protein, partial [Polypterus senegalus]|nr:C209E protein [Polypterus senegalus]
MCPQGWLLLNSKCYFFSSNKLDWDSSRDNCTSMRGHLVIIESEEEQNFLQNELNRNGLESYWIGLTDSAVEGHFVWVDGRPLDSRLRICSWCPPEWVMFNSKCYFFSTDKMDWNLSDVDCNTLGGHLVIIESYKEQQFLKNEITKRGHGKSYWIGLTDCQTEGRFYWVDGSPLDSHKSFWDTDNNGGFQPDNWKNNGLSPKGEDCVHLQILPYSSGWHDGFCERQEKRICEAATQKITLNM